MTALRLVEQHGLDALTMRRVASALKVTPMSLYNHVADKAELVDLMVDFIIGDVVAQSANDQGDWEAKLRAQAIRNHEIWRRHPGFVRVYAEGVTLGPNGLANMDWAIGLLREAGFDEQEAAAAFLLLYRWSMATLLVGRTRPVSRSYQQASPNVASSKSDRMRALFSARPLEEVPNVEATMMYLSGTSIDFGLDIVMAGLKARLACKAQAQAESDGRVDPTGDGEVNPKTDGKALG